jgi:hypothetical protein
MTHHPISTPEIKFTDNNSIPTQDFVSSVIAAYNRKTHFTYTENFSIIA